MTVTYTVVINGWTFCAEWRDGELRLTGRQR